MKTVKLTTEVEQKLEEYQTSLEKELGIKPSPSQAVAIALHRLQAKSQPMNSVTPAIPEYVVEASKVTQPDPGPKLDAKEALKKLRG